MPDMTTFIGLLLVVGPLVGAVPIAHPALIPVWSAPRETHLAIVGAHRRAWVALNAGFAVATMTTAVGLALLVATMSGDPARTIGLATAALAYAIGGALWCSVLAVRSRTTPLLADLVAGGRPTQPAEAVLNAAVGGLFGGFVLTTGAAIVVLSVTLALGGGVGAPVAWIAAGGAGALIVAFLVTGDTIPATLYVPTMLVGVALILGWT